MADNTDPASPDRDLVGLPAAQLHEDGAGWPDQTTAYTAPANSATSEAGDPGWPAHPAARVSRRPRGLLPAVTMIGIIGLFAAILHGLLTQAGIAPPPAGWQTRTPPTNEQFTSYAVSPDVPGLIVACIGDQAPHVSAGKMGPAHIWRSRDAGRHWQELGASGFYAGCEIALPAGGRGTVVVENHFVSQEFVAVSRDAGDTWKTVASESTVQGDVVRSVFGALSAGIYRDGRLYALSPLQTTADDQSGANLAQLFAYTPDDGAMWIPIETTSASLSKQGFLVLGFAADFRAPDAWFRVLARGPNAAQNSAASAAGDPAAYLQHSSNGGRTWTTLGPIGLIGAARYSFELESVSIATTPSQPSRICTSFVAVVGQLARTGAAARTAGAAVTTRGAVLALTLGPPYRAPLDVAIEASSDGGHTWTGGTIVHHQHNEGFVGGAALDQRGNCYLADNATGSKADGTPTSDATIRQLRSEQSDAEPAYHIPGRSAQLVGVSPSGGEQPAELIATVETPQPPIFCIGDVCPAYTPHPLQLLATTLP